MKTATLSNNECTALLELRKLLEARVGLIDFRIFGSKARGDASPDSDIDVMIEVEEYTPLIEAEIDEIIYKTNLKYDCFISVVIFGRREIEEGPLAESPLYRVTGGRQGLTADEKRQELIRYRLKQADESLEEALFL